MIISKEVAENLKRAIIQSAEEKEAFKKVPEFQEQGRLANNWVVLSTFAAFTKKYGMVFCPNCHRTLATFSCCGLSLGQMADLAGKKMTEHANVVGEALKPVRQALQDKWANESNITHP